MKVWLQSWLLIGALAAANPAAALQITNGGFELGACGSGNTLGALGCNTASLPGWTLNGPVNWYKDGFTDLKQIGLHPHSGASAINLASPDGSVREATQRFLLPFVEQQRYNVSFWVGTYDANGGDGAVVASITDGTSNTIQFGEVTPRPVSGALWERVGFTFIGDGTSNTITFSERPGLSYQLSYLGLDDVNISAAPEASTWILMLLGFAGLAFAGGRARASHI